MPSLHASHGQNRVLAQGETPVAVGIDRAVVASALSSSPPPS
jgi:hypothetical protein